MKKIVLALLLSTGLYAVTHSAKVVQSLNSGGYTYIKVQEGSDSYWIAMTQRTVTKGETIEYKGRGWKRDFRSKKLNRTFDKILFASDVSPASASQKEHSKPDVMDSEYKQSGTITVAELFANRDSYAGKKVRVRGKVIKTSAQIMKKNWVHIQDGSSFQGQDDLLFITTAKMPEKGSVVIAEGLMIKDRDYGYGYFYSVIVEKSTFSVK